jgi:phosphatidylethanolamine-binding protein (PEBP) family uncharacterized protein
MKLVSSTFRRSISSPALHPWKTPLAAFAMFGRTPTVMRSLVLFYDDPDARAGTWHHWAAYDLPPIVAQLTGGAAQNKNIKQAVNDFRKAH